MRNIFILGQGFLFTFLLSITVVQAEIVNPHLQPDSCLSCHTKVPSAAEVSAGNYFFIGETIDDTCGSCHLSHVGAENDHHPDTGDWERNRYPDPEILPLKNGKITCITCHFCLAPDDPTVHLLRKVAHRGDLDWSELCRDCHVSY